MHKKTVIISFILIHAIVFADVPTNRQIKPLPPRLKSLEEELIYDSKKTEEIFYKRGKVYDEKEAIDYINKIGSKIWPNTYLDKNINLNVKIIRDPVVNAFAMPNGSIYIHTGALARLENEAQLAYLLGHEISHIINRDSVYNTQSWHNKTICYKLVDIILAPTSIFFGILGDLTQLGFFLLHAATITGYGRKIEARADKDAVRWAVEAEYDPQKAIGIIEIFLSEKDKYQKGQEIFFLMSHPKSEWRLKEMQELISKECAKIRKGKIRSEEFLKIMTKIKLYNATLNIKIDRLEHANDNIQWILQEFPNNPEAHYLAGEIYRLKAEDKNKLKDELSYEKWKELNKGYKKDQLEKIWLEEAMKKYNRAIECDPEYPHSYKGLALLYNYKNDKKQTLEKLKKYLDINPDARDKRYIMSLIKRVSEEEQTDKSRKKRRRKR